MPPSWLSTPSWRYTLPANGLFTYLVPTIRAAPTTNTILRCMPTPLKPRLVSLADCNSQHKTNDMKRRLLVVLSTLFLSSLIVVNAQTSLAGHSYHHPNIMVDAMNDATKDMDKKIAEAKKKTIAEGEKKKGRKLTADEIAKIDKELKEKVEQINAMKKGMKTALTIQD